MDYLLYIDEMPVTVLCKEEALSKLVDMVHNAGEFTKLVDFLNESIMGEDEIEGLRSDLAVINNSELNTFRWLTNTIAEQIEQAVEDREELQSVFVKTKMVDLYNLIGTLADKWQEKYFENPKEIKSAHIIISDFFEDIYRFHGFDLTKDDDGWGVADVLKDEVYEYWGGTCWEKAELNLNEIGCEDTEEMNFKELIDHIYWACKEHS